jgi:hypothetical protein
MRVLLAIALCGCGPAGAPPPKLPLPTTGRPPLAGFERADLVAFRGGDVVAYSLANDKIAELGTFVLQSGDADGAWADREHLFVNGAREVVMITAAAAVHLPVPPREQLVAPKPDKHDEGLEAGGDGSLVIARGAATWTRCAWGYPYDGFQCEVWVHAELWPKREIRVEKTRLDADAWRWSSAAPAGFDVRRGEHAVTCAANGSSKSLLRGGDDEWVVEAAWASTAPPQLLVVWGRPGLADLAPDRWTLHDGCAETPIASGTKVAPGPAGYWLSADGDGAELDTVRRGARVLGKVSGSLAFRPR